MRHRWTVSAGCAAVIAVLMVFAGPVAGQAPAGLTVPAGWTDVPRTADGKPDLQGVYNAATLTPVERPEELKGRLFLTDEEAARISGTELSRVEVRAQPSDPGREAPRFGGNVGGYNNFWIDRGSRVVQVDGMWRSSLIVDPPDGRVPAQTPEARRRNAAARGTVVRPPSDALESDQPEGPGAFDDIELRPLGERCLLGFGSTSGPPTLPNYFYNNLKQIVQTPDHVMILVEMVHDVRIVRMNSEHQPPHIKRWMGDSIGRWEGDTLVIETTNFSNKTRFRGSSENLKVTERLTRTDEDTILYQFTVEDPSTWTRPWSGEYTWIRTDEQVYEYACHEGNYALQGILKGERVLEAERAQQRK